MPRISYVPKTFSADHRLVIERANAILDEYSAQGFVLTLRQLYYQFVARDFIPNTQRSYNRLGGIINDARLAGEIDWNHLIDRTRNVRTIAGWHDPENILAAVAEQYQEHLWETQPNYVEVWIEKDAQVGNFENICDEYRLPLFSCRGYTSQSEMWSAAQRFRRIERGYETAVLSGGQEKQHHINPRETLILHFGDHDPSGVDMTRDIQDRLALFGAEVEVRRLALTMAQIERFSPPPNPAKLTDARAVGYIARYGDDSWELDSMEPAFLAGLVRDTVAEIIDDDLWAEASEREDERKAVLVAVSENWANVTEYVEENFR